MVLLFSVAKLLHQTDGWRVTRITINVTIRKIEVSWSRRTLSPAEAGMGGTFSASFCFLVEYPGSNFRERKAFRQSAPRCSVRNSSEERRTRHGPRLKGRSRKEQQVGHVEQSVLATRPGAVSIRAGAQTRAGRLRSASHVSEGLSIRPARYCAAEGRTGLDWRARDSISVATGPRLFGTALRYAISAMRTSIVS